MRHAYLAPVVLLVALVAGCQNQTPVQTALDSHTAYNVALSGLVDARRAGLINDQQKAQIELVRAPAYDAILAMDSAAIADNKPGFDAALKQFKATLPALQKYLLIYAKPTTRPLN